jgi:hypothetical protein
MLTSKFAKSALISIALLGFSGAGIASAQTPMPPQPEPAQTEVSDRQIDQFVNAYQTIQQVQAQAQQDMVAAVEAEGLTVEEFQDIAQAQQSPESTADVSQTQAEQFAVASERIASIDASATQEIQTAIQSEGLTPEEFEQILTLARQDPALQDQINQRLAQ